MRGFGFLEALIEKDMGISFLSFEKLSMNGDRKAILIREKWCELEAVFIHRIDRDCVDLHFISMYTTC